MEQEFYRDEFEQLLKDTTDDFKMYPSRKVWHSIYNDLHPDRKWPSLAVCLLLLTGILYVGVSNNNAINNETKKNSAALSLNNTTENNLQVADSEESTEKPSNPQRAIVRMMEQTLVADQNFRLTTQTNDFNISATADEVFATTNTASNNINSGKRNTDVVASESVNTSATGNTQDLNTNNKLAKVVPLNPAVATETNSSELAVDNELKISETIADAETEKLQDVASENVIKNATSLLAANKTAANNTREWVEDFAFHNKPHTRNLLKGWATNFYITPSIGYKVLFKNSDVQPAPVNNNSLIANAPTIPGVEEIELNQQGIINMEMGFGLSKEISKKFRLKTGIQFNHTNYITYAQRLEHPVETALLVKDGASGATMLPYSASFAHVPGKNDFKLQNRSMQISIPVGLEYKMLTHRNISWYLGAAAQPTYVADGSFYLLSADKNYFVDGQDFIRKWNLNGSIESFVSIKTKGGTFINLGPQFRYQLMSSFKKGYTYTEKPYSIGFKIGFSRSL